VVFGQGYVNAKGSEWYAFRDGIHHKIGMEFLENLYARSSTLRRSALPRA